MISLTKDKRMLGYESLGAYSNISHFVTTRHGGVSKGTYGTFNCSPYTDDTCKNVWANQQALLAGLKHPARDLILPRQTHGSASYVIDDSYLNQSLLTRRACLDGVDALITDKPGYCICVSTADCVPVLLYDKTHRAVAAIHAGWRGTVKHIVQNVLEHMRQLYGTGGEDVLACIGPSISLESFEVGEEVYKTFQKEGFDMSRISLWNEETSKHHIDLWEANRIDLMDSGVPADQIEGANLCTYMHHEDFFSARRLGIDSGRILSGIMINDDSVVY